MRVELINFYLINRDIEIKNAELDGSNLILDCNGAFEVDVCFGISGFFIIHDVEVELKTMRIDLEAYSPRDFLEQDQYDWYVSLVLDDVEDIDDVDTEDILNDLIVEDIDTDYMVERRVGDIGEYVLPYPNQFDCDGAIFEIKDKNIAECIWKMLQGENFKYVAVFNDDVIADYYDYRDAKECLCDMIDNALENKEEIWWEDCYIRRQEWVLLNGDGDFDINDVETEYRATKDPKYRQYIKEQEHRR